MHFVISPPPCTHTHTPLRSPKTRRSEFMTLKYSFLRQFVYAIFPAPWFFIFAPTSKTILFRIIYTPVQFFFCSHRGWRTASNGSKRRRHQGERTTGGEHAESGSGRIFHLDISTTSLRIKSTFLNNDFFSWRRGTSYYFFVY